MFKDPKEAKHVFASEILNNKFSFYEGNQKIVTSAVCD